jgi:hypothetical protein
MTTVPSVWPTSKKTTLNGSVLIVVDTMVCPIHGTSAGAATMGGDATRRGATPKWGADVGNLPLAILSNATIPR